MVEYYGRFKNRKYVIISKDEVESVDFFMLYCPQLHQLIQLELYSDRSLNPVYLAAHHAPPPG